MPATLTNTTVDGATVQPGDDRVTLASGSGVEVNHVLFVNGEAMIVKDIAQSPTFTVKRGQLGTRAMAHAVGANVYHGPAKYFSQSLPVGMAVEANEVALPRIVLPEGRVFRILNDAWVEMARARHVNQRAVDPDTGYEYILVKAGAALVDGEWVVIDGDGNAAALSTSAKGRVGILVSDAAQNDLVWAMVVGTYASALFTSGVTTACVLIAGAGYADVSTSTGGNVIFNATCTSAPSTATSPSVGEGVGTAVVNNPFVYGITTDIIP